MFIPKSLCDRVKTLLFISSFSNNGLIEIGLANFSQIKDKVGIAKKSNKSVNHHLNVLVQDHILFKNERGVYELNSSLTERDIFRYVFGGLKPVKEVPRKKLGLSSYVVDPKNPKDPGLAKALQKYPWLNKTLRRDLPLEFLRALHAEGRKNDTHAITFLKTMKKRVKKGDLHLYYPIDVDKLFDRLHEVFPMEARFT